jgi:hypothetical protein
MTDTLTLHLAEDAFEGDAQFTLTLDGVQIAGPTSVTTLHSSGTFQDLSYEGDFGTGAHAVEINFFNDAYGGTSATDRNLYVGGITFDGTNYAGEMAANNAMNGQPDTDPNSAEMFINGTVVFSDVTGITSPSGQTIIGTDGNDTLTGGSGSDLIEGLGGNDILRGDPIKEANGGNDVLIGGAGNDIFDNSSGNDTMTGGAGSDTFVFESPGDQNGNPAGSPTITDFQTGPGGDVAIFEYYGLVQPSGSSFFAFDQMYQHMTDIPGVGTQLSVNVFPQGSHTPVVETFTFDGVSRDDFTPNNFLFFENSINPAGSNGTDGPDTLVVHASEDAFDGDASLRVLVDGHQVSGPMTVTAAHGSGDVEDLTVTGSFGSGPHKVEVQFTNDAYGGSPDADRNLYIEGITYNGVDYAGQSAQNTAQNGQPDADPNAAEMYANGSVLFSGVTETPASLIVLHVSEDAFQGDAQFTVSVDGTQIGGVQTATALHSSGGVNIITLNGSFGPQGPGTIDVTFLNDAYGGTPSQDRNLYIETVEVNGITFPGATATNNAANGHAADDTAAAVMDVNGTATFNIAHTAPVEIMG